MDHSHGHTECGNRTRSFAVLVAVGPALVDLWRAVELVKCIAFWEPAVGWFVFVDDGERDRQLTHLSLFPPGTSATTIMNPRRGQGRGWSGGLVAGILAGLSWIQSNTDAEFVLKLDTDALIIGPFADVVRSCIAAHDDTGMVGTIGPSCNLDMQVELQQESHLVRMHKLVPPSNVARPSRYPELVEHEGFIHVPLDKLRSFDLVRPPIRAALANGYTSSHYCQGGAYVVTRQMIDAMAAMGYFTTLRAWIELPFCEDMTLALYAHAVGLHIYDYSRNGGVFGVQYRGLPYSPQDLLAMDYRIIHSTKGDPRYSETEIRQFFELHRRESRVVW